MDVMKDDLTAWGKRPVHRDVRALRRYNNVLRSLAKVGEIAAFAFLFTALSVFLWFLFAGNFENVIFTDGTSLSCILDGNSGDIGNVDK